MLFAAYVRGLNTHKQKYVKFAANKLALHLLEWLP